MSRFDQERFDPAPDPDLVCCICQAVLDGPLETPCRHVFCKVCIETWLSNHQTCPTCRKNIHKEDLRPVLPIIQNMINRLQMKCRNYESGCITTIPLESIDNHEINCGYEQLYCRFMKCGKAILKKDKEEHEGVLCEHREIRCARECGLLIPVKELEVHDCLAALKTKILEQEMCMNKMQQQVDDLTNNRNSLEQQLGNVERKLEDALQRLRRVHDGSVSDQISDFNDNASTHTWITEYTVDGQDDNLSLASHNTDISVVVDESMPSPVNLLVAAQDSADRSNLSESTGGNSPMILFSSNRGRGVRLNVQGNASVSYAAHESRSSGSETSGFIAESSGYGQSPMHGLDRYLSDSDDGSNARSRQDESEDRRPASPEPPYSMNNSSHDDDDDDTNSIVQASPASPEHSHYSLHTMSDSDTADALRDILNMTPTVRASSDNRSPPRSPYEQSDDDDMQDFSSSDDVSDDEKSDGYTQRVQPFYNNDAFSDDECDFVNNSPSSAPDLNGASSRNSRRRGFLSSDSDSDGSGDSKSRNSECSSELNGGSGESDHGINGNESNLTFSVASSNSEDERESVEVGQSLQAPPIPDSRSRRQSGESEQIDVQSLLDQFVEENAGLAMQQEENKADSVVSDEHVEKSLAKLTEALEEMADEVDEIEAKLRKEETKPGDARGGHCVNNHVVEAADDESYVDIIGLVQGNADDVKDIMENSLSLRDHITSPPQRASINMSSVLNTSGNSIVEINSIQPSTSRTSHSNVKCEFAQSEEKPTSGSFCRQSNRSRCTRLGTRDIQVPNTSREQDRHLEMLEEQYALKRENKNRDVERYVDHVQRIMSFQSGEVKRENQGGASRGASHDSDTRQTAKRKYDQQVEMVVHENSSKKPKYEDRSERPHRSSLFGSRNETARESSNERSAGHLHRRTNSSVGVLASNANAHNRKTVDKKHTWDPKNLNISLNVAINLDKAARGSSQGASTSTALPVNSVQQSAERAAVHSRRSVPSNFRPRERTTRERIKVENSQTHQQHRSRERPSTSGTLPNFVKTEYATHSFQGKSGTRSFNKATSTVSKPPPAATVTHSNRRSRRSSIPFCSASTFTPTALNDSDSSSEQDRDWLPVGDEPSDESISSTENEEEDTDYKLKLPIPTATLLEKYKNCDDSDDSWTPPV